MKKAEITYWYRRTLQFIVNPGREWALVREERNEVKELFRNYFIPYVTLISGITLVLSFLQYSWPYAIGYAFINLISVTTACYGVYVITREYLGNKLPAPGNTALQLSVYSSAVFTLFHSISTALINGFLSQLLGLFSFIFLRTLYTGISGTKHLPTNQKTNLFIIMGILIICLPVIFKKLLMIIFHFPVFKL